MGDCLGIKFEAIDFIFGIYSIYDPNERLELFEKIQAIDSVRLRLKRDELIRSKHEIKKSRK